MKTMRMLSNLAILAAASMDNANSFTADGTIFEPTHGYTFHDDRTLINDGSFEGGSCINTPIWTCSTDNIQMVLCSGGMLNVWRCQNGCEATGAGVADVCL